MIDLYTAGTPNGFKVSIMLEETKLPYQAHLINIRQDEQFKPEFLKINPNNKIPAIIDQEGPDGKPLALFESGAILYYLGQKTGEFLPKGLRQSALVMQWLMFQMSGIGPMLGQLHHFLRFAPEKIPYAIDRYSKEAKRLYAVLDKQLAQHEYLADTYSIADIATFPWISYHEWQQIDLNAYPQIKRWHSAIAARPAVQRGLNVPAAAK